MYIHIGYVVSGSILSGLIFIWSAGIAGKLHVKHGTLANRGTLLWISSFLMMIIFVSLLIAPRDNQAVVGSDGEVLMEMNQDHIPVLGTLPDGEVIYFGSTSIVVTTEDNPRHIRATIGGTPKKFLAARRAVESNASSTEKLLPAVRTHLEQKLAEIESVGDPRWQKVRKNLGIEQGPDFIVGRMP